jgi:hypothetical protein
MYDRIEDPSSKPFDPPLTRAGGRTSEFAADRPELLIDDAVGDRISADRSRYRAPLSEESGR